MVPGAESEFGGAARLAGEMMLFRESLTLLTELVAGHRAELEEKGFSPQVAEQMAASLHHAFVGGSLMK